MDGSYIANVESAKVIHQQMQDKKIVRFVLDCIECYYEVYIFDVSGERKLFDCDYLISVEGRKLGKFNKKDKPHWLLVEDTLGTNPQKDQATKVLADWIHEFVCI